MTDLTISFHYKYSGFKINSPNSKVFYYHTYPNRHGQNVYTDCKVICVAVHFFKTNPTDINFCLCNIWVILKTNVIYLYSKKYRLDQLFILIISGYDGTIDEFLERKKLRKINLHAFDLMTSLFTQVTQHYSPLTLVIN